MAALYLLTKKSTLRSNLIPLYLLTGDVLIPFRKFDALASDFHPFQNLNSALSRSVHVAVQTNVYPFKMVSLAPSAMLTKTC